MDVADARPAAVPRADDPAALVASRHLVVGIEEAARRVGVSPSTIRLWERQGLVAPRRTPGGARRYDGDDLDRLARILTWRRTDGLNAPAIRRLIRAATTADIPVHGAATRALPGSQPGAGAGATAAGAAAGAGPAPDSSTPTVVGPADPHPPAGSPGTADGESIGPRLRAIRTARAMSLRDAAERTGLSVSFISAFERGLSGASMGTLRRLLEAYQATVGEILEAPEDRRRLVRAADRPAAEAIRGIRIESLALGSTILEPQLFTLAPGASSVGSYSHPGEEFMHVLEGELGVWLDSTDEFYRLVAGDSLTFPSTLAHRYRALGGRPTRVIWVNSPPTF